MECAARVRAHRARVMDSCHESPRGRESNEGHGGIVYRPSEFEFGLAYVVRTAVASGIRVLGFWDLVPRGIIVQSLGIR